jgi:hypothetical protein
MASSGLETFNAQSYEPATYPLPEHLKPLVAKYVDDLAIHLTIIYEPAKITTKAALKAFERKNCDDPGNTDICAMVIVCGLDARNYIVLPAMDRFPLLDVCKLESSSSILDINSAFEATAEFKVGCIIMDRIDKWWNLAERGEKDRFTEHLQRRRSSRILFLATADSPYLNLDDELKEIFRTDRVDDFPPVDALLREELFGSLVIGSTMKETERFGILEGLRSAELRARLVVSLQSIVLKTNGMSLTGLDQCYMAIHRRIKSTEVNDKGESVVKAVEDFINKY